MIGFQFRVEPTSVNLMKRVGIFCLVAAALAWPVARAESQHNIFDDDWAPPKSIEASHPPSPVFPAPPAIPATRPATPADPQSPEKGPDQPATSPDASPMPIARLAVPSRTDQKPVRKTMKEVYGTQLADRSIAARRTFVTRLLADAEKATDAPVDHFVLLTAAIQAAVDAQDVPQAFAASHALASTFEVDESDVKADAACTIATRPAKGDVLAANLDAIKSFCDELATESRFVTAIKVLGAFQGQAASIPASRTEFQQLQKSLAEQRVAADRFAQDSAKLAASPNDPALNLAVGRYLCGMKSAWPQGLPLLAKGSDPALQAAATKELAAGPTANEVFRVADGWWDLAPKQTGAAWHAAILNHAADLYKSVLEQLTSLNHDKAEKRIAEATSGSETGQHVVDLMPLIEPKRDALYGEWKMKGHSLVASAGSSAAQLQIRYQPPAEYDFRITFVRISGNDGVTQFMPTAKKTFSWAIGAAGNTVSDFDKFPGKPFFDNPTTVHRQAWLQNAVVHTSVVKVRHDSLSAYLDGKLCAHCNPTDLSTTESWKGSGDRLGIGSWQTDVEFRAIDVTEIAGRGKSMPSP